MQYVFTVLWLKKMFEMTENHHGLRDFRLIYYKESRNLLQLSYNNNCEPFFMHELIFCIKFLWLKFIPLIEFEVKS